MPSLVPGMTKRAHKTKTPAPKAGVFTSKCQASHDLDAVVLDHRIGEQLVRRGFQRRLRFRFVSSCKLDIEHLALPHTGDAIDAQRLQRALDRLALRIEDAVLQRNRNASLPKTS